MKILSFLERMLTMLFWILLIFGFDTPRIAVMTLIAALLHEMGHLYAGMLILKKETSLPHGVLSGFRIRSRQMSYREELIFAAFGPLANLTVFIISALFHKNELIFEFGLINLMTALSNLLPISGYDGYRIICSAVSARVREPSGVLKLLWWCSFSLSSLFSLLSLYVMLKIGEGYWMFGISVGFMLSFIGERLKMRN